MHFVRPPAGALVLAVAGSRYELIVPFLYKTYSNTPFTIGSIGEPTRGMGFCFEGNVREPRYAEEPARRRGAFWGKGWTGRITGNDYTTSSPCDLRQSPE